MAPPIRPANFPDWPATGYGYLTPDLAKRTAGFHVNERPAYQYFNWLFRYGGMWHRFFDQFVDGVLKPGVYDGLAVTYEPATFTYTITPGIYLDDSARKVTDDAGTTMIVDPVALANVSGSLRIDAIAPDYSGDIDAAPAYDYVEDWPANAASYNHAPLCVILVPSGGYNPSAVLATERRLDADNRWQHVISEGVTTQGGTNITDAQLLLRAVNQLGGGAVQILGPMFADKNIQLRIPSGVVLTGRAMTRVHATGEETDHLIQMAGLKSQAGTLTAGGRTLTYTPAAGESIADIGIGSMVIFSTTPTATYFVAAIDTVANSCTLVDRTGAYCGIGNGAVTFDMYVVGAGLRNVFIDATNIPTGGPFVSNRVLRLRQTFNCLIENVVIANYAVAAKACGLIFDDDNAYLTMRKLRVGGFDAGGLAKFTKAIDVITAGANENWFVTDCVCTDRVTLSSTGAGVGEFRGNSFLHVDGGGADDNTLLGAGSGWHGKSEQRGHNIDGSHKTDATTIEDDATAGLRVKAGGIDNTHVGPAAIKHYQRSPMCAFGYLPADQSIPASVATTIQFEDPSAQNCFLVSGLFAPNGTIDAYHVQMLVSVTITFVTDSNWVAGERARLLIEHEIAGAPPLIYQIQADVTEIQGTHANMLVTIQGSVLIKNVSTLSGSEGQIRVKVFHNRAAGAIDAGSTVVLGPLTIIASHVSFTEV